MTKLDAGPHTMFLGNLCSSLQLGVTLCHPRPRSVPPAALTSVLSTESCVLPKPVTVAPDAVHIGQA